jgi:hypothetical protein
MNDSADQFPAMAERDRRKLRLAHLEADMAYFQARLELLGEPHTANQAAQRRAFKLLYKALGERVVHAKRRMMEEG